MKPLHCFLILLLAFSCKKSVELTSPGNNNNLPPEVNTPQDINKPAFKNISIKFKTVAGNEEFRMNTEYVNASGEIMKFSRFQYYLSNFILTKTNGTKVEMVNTYFLLNAGFKDSLTLANVPNEEYAGITFLIGIDSSKSKGGAHSGDLDVTQNMFMEWSGYTYVAMEGLFRSSQGDKSFSYIIRGFNPPSYYAAQQVSFTFGKTVSLSKLKRLVFNVNVLEAFVNPVNFKVANKPVIDVAGYEAVNFSLNYRDMFLFREAEEF